MLQSLWPERIRKSTVLPNEQLIWEERALFDASGDRDEPVAIQRLGLQYLSLRDFFVTNFDLYRSEALYEIRQDVEKSVFFMHPGIDTDGHLKFKGADKMSTEISAFATTSVSPPKVGTYQPSSVKGDIRLDLKSAPPDFRSEWDKLRTGDVLFMVTHAVSL